MDTPQTSFGALTKQDEERRFLPNVKLKLFLVLGFNPQTANRFLSKAQAKKFYYLWLNKMAARKPRTKA
ncbi:hypothetical protein F441_12095 [Phytophthora nicotianae CJ01A1]|uniref:Uncharacterized protein n=6 Tax=Phytophthora nicotianae TaxID=4792 RepID=W2Q002_PHYN3|nr:hypothetical protein PPTG_23380 [Phytophthora nicotianae INRA-310]ETI42805.1 hypothetical protein F443_12132 [Phytophthora nicotianae P1569]ETK82841.1 hypothetical protein L915_11850 [Phytophthora nicotianae]ETP12555.1 hypothetical protein F441_12095 [Phytophthora nicotianae CJ01A1]ETP40668.1 hypothetical protein F442_12049 [Phytophthora nicotianae P10297]ETL36218.1 hypothetical protein L916_11778 [Phytophthora nicotianae]